MIYVFLANGFEEVEAFTPVDLLRRAECQVKTVGVGGKTVTGSHGIAVTADIAQSEVITDDMEMVVLPGGMPGALNLEKNPIVTASVRYCLENGLPVGAICAAPSILGHLGALKGKRAVCFPGFEEQLLGAQVLQDPVCTDGNITTARGAGVAVDFALELVRIMAGEETAGRIRASIQCI